MTVGTVEAVCLTDATVDYPWLLPELFPGVPDEAWEPFRSRYPAAFGGRQVWRSAYRCFLLRTPAATLLLDTGMGPAGSPLAAVFGMGGRLQDELAAEGVAPEDVDVVVLSHLHPDHVGGSLRDGARLAFPNARYLVNETDWRAFHDPEVQRHFPFSFVAENITPLETLGALELVGGDHAVTDEVTLAPAPGHTPGHMTVWIESGGDERRSSPMRCSIPPRSRSPTGRPCSTWTRSGSARPVTGCSTSWRRRRRCSRPATSPTPRSAGSSARRDGGTGRRSKRADRRCQPRSASPPKAGASSSATASAAR